MSMIVDLLVEFVNAAGDEKHGVICEIEKNLLLDFAPEWWEKHKAEMLRLEKAEKARIMESWKADKLKGEEQSDLS